MSARHEGGQAQPTIDREEHRSVNGVDAKAVVPYVFDGSSLVPAQGGLVPDAYDYISCSSGTLADTYIYKLGGSSGTTVRTITVTYTDSTKDTLQSVART